MRRWRRRWRRKRGGEMGLHQEKGEEEVVAVVVVVVVVEKEVEELMMMAKELKWMVKVRFIQGMIRSRI